MNKLIAALLFAVPSIMLLGVSACTPDGQRAEAPKAEAKLTEEEALRRRVNARWEAFIALDFEKVYEFASPAYRATNDLVHFKNQYAGQIKRTGFNIYKVNIDEQDPSTAEVVVLLEFITEGAPGQMLSGTSRVAQTWIKRDGQWWMVEER